jgi:hypothetical protein
LQIIGAILLIVGIPACVVNGVNADGSRIGQIIGAVLGAAGAGCYFGGRFLHWYDAE